MVHDVEVKSDTVHRATERRARLEVLDGVVNGELKLPQGQKLE